MQMLFAVKLNDHLLLQRQIDVGTLGRMQDAAGE
jgi:hypothetical protein